MNCIIVRKQKQAAKTSELYFFLCRYGLCPALFWDLACLLGAFLGIPVFPPQHSPLSEIIKRMIQCRAFAGMLKVPRTVCIPIEGFIVTVRIKAAMNIRDYRVLSSLAILAFQHSPEWKRLPFWMRRKLSRSSRHIHLVTTNATYDKVLGFELGSLAGYAKERAAAALVLQTAKTLEFESVKRVLLWKQAGTVARYMTLKDLGHSGDFLGKDAGLLANMPPACTGLLNDLCACNRLLGKLCALGFIALEKEYPNFFFTKQGQLVLAAAYLCTGTVRISLNTVRAFGHLALYCVHISRGELLASALSQTWNGYPGSPFPAPSASMLGRFTDLLKGPEKTSGLPDDGKKTSGAADGPADGQESFECFPGGIHEAACTCDSCRNPGQPKKPVRIVPVSPKKAEGTKGPDVQEDATNAATEGLGQTEGAPAPQAVRVEESAAHSAAPETAVEDGCAPEDSAKAQSVLFAYLKAALMKKDGKVPGIVDNAASVDNAKKSGARRRINRYHGNIPALSVEAMVEVIDHMFPGCYITDFVKATHKNEKDIIYLHSRSSEIVCPCCGQKNKWERDANTRTVYDTPMRNGNGLKLELTMGRAKCSNPQCPLFEKTYSEQCPFAASNRSHTKRVQFLAAVMCASSSFRDTERQLGLMGVEFGDDRVKELLTTMEFSDEKDLEVLGMDDVAILKGQVYCTILYNMENGHALKLIEGRSGKAFEKQLCQWLDQHPKVRLVCRDRAAAYGCYIDRYCLTHPDRKIEQCADRFHLLQNMSKHLFDCYYHCIPKLIALSVDKDNGEGSDKEKGKATILDEAPNLVAVPISPKKEGLENLRYDNTSPLDEDGRPIEFAVSIDRLPDRKKIERMEKNDDLYIKICQVRSDYDAMGRTFKWGQKKAFLLEHGISDYKFKQYIDMTPEELEAIKGSWKPASKAKLYDSYKYIAYKMLKDGHSICDVFWYIRDVAGGWDKGDTTLMEYVCETYKFVFKDRPAPLAEDAILMKYPNDELVIGRRKLFYALMTYDEKKQDKKLTPYLDLICSKYPECEKIRSIAKEFHDIIIVDEKISKRTPEKCAKAVESLKAFIKKHRDDELSGFASALEGDIKCIINAINMPESSGKVEGSNCKMKKVKRDEFGHVETATLERKLMLSFMYTDSEFTFADIAPWLMESLED